MNSYKYAAVVAGALTVLSLLGASVASARGHHESRTGERHHRVETKRPAHSHKSTERPSSSGVQEPLPASALPFLPPAVSPEGQQATPVTESPVYRQITDRKRFYIPQVTSYTCGPVSLAMAIADHLLHMLPTEALVKELTKETGTRKADGLPAWWETVPPIAAKHGLQNTKVYTFEVGDHRAMDALDAELLQGHSAMVHTNNPRTSSGGGHFIYVAGKTKEGGYVVGNPDAPANSELGHNKEVSREDMENMMVGPLKSHPKWYKGVPGFVAMW